MCKNGKINVKSSFQVIWSLQWEINSVFVLCVEEISLQKKYLYLQKAHMTTITITNPLTLPGGCGGAALSNTVLA